MASRPRLAALFVPALLALAGCGTGEHHATGAFVVEPEGTTELVVTGMERTELQLDGRGGATVQMDSDDGETETFGHDSSWRKVFTGTLTLTFRNATQDRATIHYHVTSSDGVSVEATQRDGER